MNRKKLLMAAVALCAAFGLAASGSAPTVPKASGADHSVQQYHTDGQRYLGRAQHVLDGQALQANPQEFIEETGISPLAGLIGPTTAERLLKGATQTSPVVVDYDLATPQFKQISAGARAILETRVRVNHSQKINVLFGQLYGLRVDRPEDFATGAYATNMTTARFDNSILYLEHHTLGQMVTVVVSVGWTNQENVRQYLAGDISRMPQEGEFFSSPEGVSMYEKVQPNPFINEQLNLRVWSARRVLPCKPGGLSSKCLYKAYQPNFTHQGHQQVVLVGMAGTLQVDRPETPGSDYRFVDTFPVVRLGDGTGRMFRIGSYGPERTKKLEMRDPTNQMTVLLQEGGTLLDESALANLKAYSFK